VPRIAGLVALGGAAVAFVAAGAVVLAPEDRSSPKRLKAIEFCGPQNCYAMPARQAAIEGSLFNVGQVTTRPRMPVRYYRVGLQYAPTGRGTALFVPSLGMFRTERGWWKVPPAFAETLRRVTRFLRPFGPRRF
jgi:hypothetical protein